jgi:hypothetical protein
LGEAPSHPELLDWLASEFMAGDWRLKALHRTVLTSHVYRQSPDNPAAAEADPENKLLARWKLRRLEAEAVRDAILTVSGSLQQRMYGEPVPIAQDNVGRVVAGRQILDGRSDPTIVGAIGEEAWRRSVYVQVRRTLPLTVLEAFDAPMLSPNCELRAAGVAPAQSLMLLNDAFVAEQALIFARRLAAQATQADYGDLVRGAWRVAFGTAPSAEELRRGEEYLAAQTGLFQQRASENGPSGESAAAKVEAAGAASPEELALASLCQALLGSSRFLYIE